VKPIEPDILRSKVAVFVELFKKTREVKHQAELLEEKESGTRNANLARLNILIDLGKSWPLNMIGNGFGETFATRPDISSEHRSRGRVIDGDGQRLRYFFRCATEDKATSDGVPQVVERALKYLSIKNVVPCA